MSSEEKRTWISAVVGVVVSVAYLVTVLSEVPGTDVARIAYVGSPTRSGRCASPTGR